MVTTADRLASMAGARILRDGGSAADAAVAAGAVLAVTSPHMCGMGGDLFALVHRPGEPVAALCAAGRAGSGADALLLRCEGFEQVPGHGDVRAVTVPGCVDGWLELHGRHGRLPLGQVLDPAITYAAAGFPVGPYLASTAGDILDRPGADDFRAPAQARGGRLEPGAIVRRPGIAGNLSAVVADGRRGFYLGSFGEGLVELGGGLFTRGDLARSQAEWTEPLQIRAWGHDLWCPPPPSQGYLTLAGAAVAAALTLPDDPGDPAWPHLLAEAARQVGRDRPRVLHDGADGAALLAPERLAERTALVDPDRRGEAPLATLPGDTTALGVVDDEGMGVSLIQSNAAVWGARIFEPQTGEVLHSRGRGFSLEAGHPAEYRPGARPPHTLSPVLVTRPDGGLRAVLGTMGGDGQPQILLQLLTRLLHHGARRGTDLDDAVAAPRWLLGDGMFGTWDGDGPEGVLLESGAAEAWEPGLTARGHRVERSTEHPDHRFGHAHVVVVDDDGSRHGAADPRTEIGAAIDAAVGGAATPHDPHDPPAGR
jgi:gamma-glutamyltranspeptidase / glutathione hydrolase